MWMKMPARSGAYALCIRYKSVGVGMDTDKWKVVIDDPAERLRRHQAILSALRDQLLSPEGALTAILLPHLAGLAGIIAVRSSAGRAPLYSPLETEFVAHLTAMSTAACQMLPFKSVEEFHALINQLIETSDPYLPACPRPHPAQSARPKGKTQRR